MRAGLHYFSVLLILSTTLLASSCSDRYFPSMLSPAASQFSTPRWHVEGELEQYGDHIAIRANSHTRNLLLRHSRLGGVYRYDPATNHFQPVQESDWQEADGIVTECDRQFSPLLKVLRQDDRGRLLRGERQIPTAAPVTVNLLASPDGLWVGVLSAEGKRRDSLLPFLGSGGYTGKHYHQTFLLSSMEPVGPPIRLMRRRDLDLLQPCWSDNQAFIFYFDTFYDTVSVVPTGIARAENR